jgi:hypothetical protein
MKTARADPWLVRPGESVPWPMMWRFAVRLALAIGVTDLVFLLLDPLPGTYRIVAFMAAPQLYLWHRAKVRRHWWAAGVGLVAGVAAGVLAGVVLPPDVPGFCEWSIGTLVAAVAFTATHLPRRYVVPTG